MLSVHSSRIAILYMGGPWWLSLPLQWLHNERDGVSNHWRIDCLLNRLFRCRSKKTPKAPRHWTLWGEFSGHRWIPCSKFQWRGKCFHLMRSSWRPSILRVQSSICDNSWYLKRSKYGMGHNRRDRVHMRHYSWKLTFKMTFHTIVYVLIESMCQIFGSNNDIDGKYWVTFGMLPSIP